MKHHTINIENVKIHYVEAGPNVQSSTFAKSIVFLHGFPEYWGTWHAQLECFAKDYRVIAPDLPGYHLSDKPKETSFFTVPNLIQFMAKFIQKVAVDEKIVLVAHDWGGAIAWPLAAFFPDLIDRLVILNAAHPTTFTREMSQNPQQRKKSEYIHQLIAPDGVETLQANNFEYLKEKIFAGMRAGTLTDAQIQAYINVWSIPGAVEGMVQYYRAMPQVARSSKIPNDKGTDEVTQQVKSPKQMKIPNIRINCPTLVLWGEQDQAFVKENLNGLEAYVTDLQVKRYADASHWLQHELPNEVNTQIKAFLKSC